VAKGRVTDLALMASISSSMSPKIWSNCRSSFFTSSLNEFTLTDALFADFCPGEDAGDVAVTVGIITAEADEVESEEQNLIRSSVR